MRDPAASEINIEFVSAYPSRPLRGEDGYAAIIGDVIARMADAKGARVTREYYVGDTGPQADALARGVYARLVAWDEFDPDEITSIAERVRGVLPAGLQGRPEAEWLEPVRAAAIAAALDEIKASLAALDVRFDVFTFESALETDGALERLFARFAKQGALLDESGNEIEGADLPESTRILLDTVPRGDLRPRPLTDGNGSYTYYAADLAYHAGKLERGFTQLIDVFRRDHASYAPGLVAGVDLMSNGRAQLGICLIDPVRPMDDDEASPRAPEAASIPPLADLIEFYGARGLRRLMLSHKPGTPLELGLDADLRGALEAAEARQAEALGRGAAAPRTPIECDAIAEALDARAPHMLMAAADMLAEEIIATNTPVAEDIAALAQMRCCLGLSDD